MNDLRDLQLAEMEILCCFKEICESHNLTYYLTAGSLLGAVRHQGFIPWDDDIDVVMPRKDYQKFSKIAPKALGQSFFFQNYKTDKNFPFYFSKIRKQNTQVEEEIFLDVTMHKGIYIDIFPLDVCPNSARVAKVFFKGIEFLSLACLSKVSQSFSCGYVNPYMIVSFKIARTLPLRLLYCSRELLRIFITATTSGQMVCTVGGRHGYPIEAYQKQWFSATEWLEFEGGKFPAPNKWHAILSSMYGDYMVPPPVDEREGHFEILEEEEKS